MDYNSTTMQVKTASQLDGEEKALAGGAGALRSEERSLEKGEGGVAKKLEGSMAQLKKGKGAHANHAIEEVADVRAGLMPLQKPMLNNNVALQQVLARGGGR